MILFAIAILSCAKVEAPSGGPEDKTAPQVLAVFPSDGSVNVPDNTNIEIVFSKNMNKASTEKAVFISPLFFNYPRFIWKGKKLEIALPEMLRANTTYALTIGASAQDLRGNKLGETKTYSFSTGEIIYNGEIFGKVFADETRNMYIWAYKLQTADPDTFWMKVPDYVTQPDSLGKFGFKYLSFGYYLVVAVQDKNNDQFWEPPSEKLGLPDTLIYLNESSQKYGPLFLMPVEGDTLMPHFAGVQSPDSNTLIIEFSQQMDSSSVRGIENYKIYQSKDSLRTAIIDYILPLDDYFKKIYLSCSGLSASEKYKIAARDLKSIYGVQADTLSRLFDTGGADTTKPQIISLLPLPSQTPRAAGFDIKFRFSEPIDTASLDANISIVDTLGNHINNTLKWPLINYVVLAPEFIDGEVYKMILNEKSIVDQAGESLGDSSETFYYITAPADTFGQILGRVVHVPRPGGIIVIAQPQKGDEIKIEAKNDGTFYFARLFPGTYNLWAFYDKNHNGLYDGGWFRPFRFAEPIAAYADTIDVRARWETDIGQLDFAPSTN